MILVKIIDIIDTYYFTKVCSNLIKLNIWLSTIHTMNIGLNYFLDFTNLDFL